MTPPKPHRVFLDKVSGYADEAAAYMRRRRASRRPFARLYYPGGRAVDHAADAEAAGELFVAAGRLIEVAGAERASVHLVSSERASGGVDVAKRRS